MRTRLSPGRRAQLINALEDSFAREFDEPISDFRAEALLDVLIEELGPPVYNQGVRDASSYMQEKLAEIEGAIYETERKR